MPVTYDRSDLVAPLPVSSGVAAFDPVMLRIAGEAFGQDGHDLSAHRSMVAQPPETLAGLAEVSCTPEYVRARIDTGVLRWGPDLDPSATELEAYDGRIVGAVSLGELPVAEVGGAVVTTAPMVVRRGGGKTVQVWFAELPAELDDVEGFGLVGAVTRVQREWQSVQRQPTWVTVPRQHLEYRSSIPTALACDGEQSLGIEQNFSAELDETGARVVAETIAVLCVPESFPPVHDFGSRGPVIFWFTEGEGRLPFSIMYTAAQAWMAEEEGDELEVDKYRSGELRPRFPQGLRE